MKPIRVLIADDHPLIRLGIRTQLEGDGEIQVIAEAGDGREAVRLIEKHLPDIVFLDISMPGLSGLDVLDQVGTRFPGVSTIILTLHESEEYARRAFKLGAMGYLTKTAPYGEVQQAVKTVARKEKYVCPALLTRFLDQVVDGVRGRKPSEDLTPRQLEVLRRIAEGQTTKGIALQLEISVKTVESHRAQLMERLDIHDIAGLVRCALRMGLVED